MDLIASWPSSPTQGDYYPPAGVHPISGSPSSTMLNCIAYLAPRNYTITSLWARTKNAVDDSYENFTLYINGSSTIYTIGPTIGERIYQFTGLSIPVTAGDEIALLWNALADNSGVGMITSIHLEPA